MISSNNPNLSRPEVLFQEFAHLDINTHRFSGKRSFTKRNWFADFLALILTWIILSGMVRVAVPLFIFVFPLIMTEIFMIRR